MLNSLERGERKRRSGVGSFIAVALILFISLMYTGATAIWLHGNFRREMPRSDGTSRRSPSAIGRTSMPSARRLNNSISPPAIDFESPPSL